ncbi:MAG TPA: pyridoxal-phosphate dependent enzyme [Candidatus Paceibacterota bacterium]|nr:pyridoxal-phosphate dependent enzyme [Candidatus Paceibacterota bacterium]
MAKLKKTPLYANVFAGKHAMVHYVDPSMHAYGSLVELPRGTPLNPFPRAARVRLFMKVMGAELPGNTFKIVPVFEWYEQQQRLGKITSRTVVNINSSGGAGLAAVLVGHAMGVRKIRVFMPEDAPIDKQLLIRRAGGELHLTKDRPGRMTSVEKVRKMARLRNHLVFDQYGDDINWKGHVRVTMHQLWEQMALLGTFPGGIVAAKGTCGTLIAARESAKLHQQGSRRTLAIGVECEEGEPIPAVRPASRLGPKQIRFNHKQGTMTVKVERYEAYQMTLDLFSMAALELGLSSGAALCGAHKALIDILRNPDASRPLRDKDGILNLAVISGDGLGPYLNQLRVILDPKDL